jgi:cellulose synthase (UDP-forming)
MKSRRVWLDDSELFTHRRARPVATWERWIIGVLAFLGLQSVVLFGFWWFQPSHVQSVPLFVLLTIAVWYGISRIVVGWYNYFHVDQPRHVAPAEDISVAIFITASPGEPYSMFERTLEAAANLRHPHTTYLLDDTTDPAIAELARASGAVHLELIGIPGAKAGKINAALGLTDEEFILVLDPDHIPFPQFLDRVLGHFSDSAVGFVQVAQTYYNASRSFVARAACEQTFAFYGPIMQGMHGTGTTVAIGANCTFRRAALESIGGHGLGLAEDLVTSIRLHANGWRSVYVPEVLARGLVPEDLDSFLRQQLKWGRGVFEVLFREYPRAFRRLTIHQKISYLMIGSYYLFGLTTPIYLLVPLIYLWTGVQPAAMFLSEFLERALPVGFFGTVIYLFAQRWMVDPVRERGAHWRGMLLKIGSWSVYLYGFWLAIRRIEVPYIPTSKVRQSGNFWKLSRVPLVVLAISGITAFRTLYVRLYHTPESTVRITTEAVYGMLGFLLVNMAFMSGRIYAAWKTRGADL